MKQRSLDRITVCDICHECQVSRQTFYRHFKDKYELVNWYFRQLCDKSFLLMGVSLTLREALHEKFSFLENEKPFFSQAFRSQDSENLKQYDYRMIYSFYTKAIEKQLQRPLPEDLRFLLEMYCEGSIYMTVRWLTGYLEETIDQIVSLLIASVPNRLRPYLLALNEK
ncbi:MAG: TetR/AcrR family transcriptional regulator [Spirochaetia bacterium]|nr:TetR/AcrR family transcriptional regulator [Spirochaetia bacterium]